MLDPATFKVNRLVKRPLKRAMLLGAGNLLPRLEVPRFPKSSAGSYRAPPSSPGFQGRRRGHQAGTARR
jgi:hypothetical protein